MSEEKNGSYKGLPMLTDKMGESATAFINRAIDEAIKRDQESNPETQNIR